MYKDKKCLFFIFSIFLSFILLGLTNPSKSRGQIIFEDNFDSHPDWSPAQPNATEIENTCRSDTGCNSAPKGYAGYFIDKSYYRNPTNPGKNTLNIDSTNFRGNGGKSFTFWNEVCDGCGWASDGLLDIKLNPSGYSELYVRFYMKFDPNWKWRNDGVEPMQKFLHVSHYNGTGNPYDFYAPTPNKPAFIGDLAKWNLGNNFSPVSNYMAILYDGLDSEYITYPVAKSTDNIPNPAGGICNWNETGCLGDGKWHSWEFYFKINSAPGVADGVHKFWIDGNLVSMRSDIMWSTANGQATPRRKWNYVWLGGNNSNRFAPESQQPEQFYAIDDLVISTSYVGPNYVIGGGNTNNNAPNSAIDTPQANVTITAGQSVNFTGTGTDPDGDLSLSYNWNFGGGAANSTVEDPGAVTFSTPGTYTVTFTVTDSLGAPDATPASITITVNPMGDTTPPSLSAINSQASSTSAAVTWTTNEPATSLIDYGLTSAYGNTVSDTTLKTSHSITLNGLSPNTTYNYSISSTDAAGNIKYSQNLIFATLISSNSTLCAPLAAPPSGTAITTVTPSMANQLPSIISSAQPGTTILFTDGTYSIPSTLQIQNSNITLRSQSGNRNAVILDGGYRTYTLIQVFSPNVTIADLTLKRTHEHLVHALGGAHYLNLYNINLVDAGQQFVKVNPSGPGNYNDYGKLSCSTVELTSQGRQNVDTASGGCYTGGIDAHQSMGWTVNDNIFKNIYCTNGGLAEYAVHFWTTSRDTVVERNTITNCARGIGFGLGGTNQTIGGTTPHRQYADNPLAGVTGYVGHIGGIIRNNMIFGNIGSNFDTGIGLEQSFGALVYHNTVYSTGGTFSSIDIRYSNSNPVVKNNLVSPIITQRDNPSPTLAGNMESAAAGMFTNMSTGNLHLANNTVSAIDNGISLLGSVPDDIDGEKRDSSPDVGADEYIQTQTPKPPVAKASSNITSGTAPLTVTFDGSGSTDADGTITAYSWDFGSGVQKSGAQVTYTFSNPGSYTVTLKVTDNSGLFSQHTVTITVNQAVSVPAVSIIEPVTASSYTTTQNKVRLFGTSTDTYPITSVRWSNNRGGSGQAFLALPDWEADNLPLVSGENIITVTATNTQGQKGRDVITITYTPPNSAPNGTITLPAGNMAITAGSSVNFTGTGSDPDGDLSLSYLWNFGGGASNSTVASPGNVTFNNTGVYTVTFTVTDSLGLSDPTPASITVTVSVQPDTTNPTVTISAPTSLGTYSTTNSSISLSGNATDNKDVTAVTWTNSRGGSGSATGTTSWSVPSLTLTAGQNIITVTASDSAGNTSTDSISVFYAPPNSAPQGTIRSPAGNQTINVGQALIFSGTGTDSDNNTPLSYFWDFGGATTDSYVKDPGIKTFTIPGTYTITLTVTDNLGKSDPNPPSITITINAKDDTPPSPPGEPSASMATTL